MGSGADTSEVQLLLVSICSTPDTSIGCSPEPGQTVEGLPEGSGPRSQESPPENFKGLWKRRKSSSLQHISKDAAGLS